MEEEDKEGGASAVRGQQRGAGGTYGSRRGAGQEHYLVGEESCWWKRKIVQRAVVLGNVRCALLTCAGSQLSHSLAEVR